VLVLIFSADAMQRYFSIRMAQPANPYLKELNSTLIGAMIFLLLGLSVNYASVIIFQRRKFYLE
jgi:hypothetical protein